MVAIVGGAVLLFALQPVGADAGLKGFCKLAEHRLNFPTHDPARLVASEKLTGRRIHDKPVAVFHRLANGVVNEALILKEAC